MHVGFAEIRFKQTKMRSYVDDAVPAPPGLVSRRQAI
ncbi:unnamed protein product [Chondrus crispus]|uniref:Uncharacterized protein n=1 Tax=Chondrus crispus TaxID=2769 RepID=R7QJX7_CHOCR|nr:unnamed protein product [Chondrus crispus]CDF37781.1 unnamed protein product [Chondrus crispus]|eukprot:XP_005717652.1 unnamed protein product [Chondrus crispus]